MKVEQQSSMVRKPVEVLASNPTEVFNASPTVKPVRVLHVLSVSVPHLNGYTMRSKYIVQTQHDLGMAEPVVVTSPFYAGNAASIHDESIDGVSYYRIAHPSDVSSGLRWDDRLCRASFFLRKQLRSKGPRVRQLLRSALLVPAKRLRKSVSRYCIQPAAKLLRRSIRVTKRGVGKLITRRRYWLALVRLLRGERTEQATHATGGGWLTHTGRAVAAVLAFPFVLLTMAFRWLGKACSINGWIRRLSWMFEAIEEFCIARRFRRELLRITKIVKPDVLHAHSPYRCGRPAVEVGRMLRIPVIYEVRGMWEDSGVAEGNFTVTSSKYRYWQKNETMVMRSADAVVCICEALREEVVSRGVPRERTYIAFNAVDSAAFSPVALHGSETTEAVLNVKQRLPGITIGYVGSIRKLEGVDETVRGAAEVFKQGCDVSLLIVGDGPGLDELKRLAELLGIGDRSVFTGRVAHDEVQSYYALIDVFVVSRPALRVTKMVTPLKPLEAMAMGKALLVSNLPALQEIVCNGVTGLTYRPGDVNDFARQCMQYVHDFEFRSSIAESARQWVVEHRSWQAILEPVQQAYACVQQRAVSGSTKPQ